MKLPIMYNKSSPKKRRKAREEYLKLQEGKCSFCNELLIHDPSNEVLSKPIDLRLFPKGMFNHPVHLHHDHKTDLTIGAVHARCNAYLWQYKGE